MQLVDLLLLIQVPSLLLSCVLPKMSDLLFHCLDLLLPLFYYLAVIQNVAVLCLDLH